jgi:translation initiation factor 2 alpha subunit (eIF-2alpha)
MDKSFLEFWGNLLISIARGQRQMEDMSRWLNQDATGLESLMAPFKKFYGLEQVPPATAKYEELWSRQFKSFQDSFQEYLKLLDVVPRREYQKVQEENQALKRQIVEMEKAIKDLRMLVAEKMGSSASEAVKGFQELVFSQMDKFQEMMRSFGGLAKDEPEKK